MDDSRGGWRYGLFMTSQDQDSGPDPNAPTKPSAENANTNDEAGKPEKSGEAKELTPEEQMAAYEEAMKNEDWGHQPC